MLSVFRCDSHNHPQNESEIRRGLLLKKMHQKITGNPTVPIRRIYDQSVLEGSDDEFVASFGGVRTRAQRMRANLLPEIPSSISDVSICNDWSKTWKKEKFLLKLDNYWGLAVFSTRRMLQVMHEAQHLYKDGTFRTAPHPYKQVMTVHGYYHGYVIPLAFALLDGKTTGQYRQVLQTLKNGVYRQTGQRLAPSKVVTDFEQALLLAIESEFPNVRTAGCYYHFCQSLWRHLQELGLARTYRRNQPFRKLVRKVMATGFLPVLLVRQNFRLLCASRLVRRLIQQYNELDDWLEYVDSTYVRNNATFPPPVWNVFTRDVDTRTNNNIEGNSKFCINQVVEMHQI